jgi:hypothetical protein
MEPWRPDGSSKWRRGGLKWRHGGLKWRPGGSVGQRSQIRVTMMRSRIRIWIRTEVNSWSGSALQLKARSGSGSALD